MKLKDEVALITDARVASLLERLLPNSYWKALKIFIPGS